jgi:hypothetical protein
LPSGTLNPHTVCGWSLAKTKINHNPITQRLYGF